MGIDVDGAPWKDDIVTEIPVLKMDILTFPLKPGLGVRTQ